MPPENFMVVWNRCDENVVGRAFDSAGVAAGPDFEIGTGGSSNYPPVGIDADGVGALMKIAVEKGRAAREGLNAGICGEHGGDPESIALCRRLGLDYVSCSPPRVPVARLAAAQAAIKERVAVPV